MEKGRQLRLPPFFLCRILAGVVSAGTFGELNRYIGYDESYAGSHEVLDRDVDFQEEVKNVARAVAHTVADIRAGRVKAPDPRLKGPRPK